MRKILSLITAVLFVGTMWAGDVTGTINFGSADGSTAVNAKSVKGNDSQGNEWTITTVMSQTSFTQNAAFSQIGSSSKPATSITFTTTLSESKTIKAFSAKFGGFSSTAGNITLKVGETTVGSGSLNGTSDVTVSKTGEDVAGTVLTVTVTSIAKGVKAYYISYTYDDGGEPDPVLQSIAVSGNPTKTTYEEGNVFDVAGLTVTGTYDIGDPATITEGITWKARTNSTSNDEAALANYHLTKGQTSLQVQATVSTIASAWYTVSGLTVNEHVVKAGTYEVTPNNAFWGRSTQDGSQAIAANALNVSVVSDDVTYNLKNNASTNSYMNSTHSRAYTGYTLTITAPEGYVLTAITFTGDTWVQPSASVGTIDVKDWTGYDNSVTFTFSGTSYMSNIEVTYEVPTTPIISAPKMDFGTAIIDESQEAYVLDTVLVVAGTNLTAAIEATGSTHVSVSGTLTVEGGNLNLHIVAAPGNFSESITLTSGETSVDVVVSGRVNQTIILPGTSATITPVSQAMSVTVDGVAGVKAGTSKDAGSLKITVPANTNKLHFFSAAWSEEAGSVTLTAPTGVTLSKSSVNIKADSGISGGGSSYTLKDLDLGDDCRFDITLSGVTAEIDITFESSSRFVVWGATYETAGSATALDNTEVEGKAVKVLKNGVLYIEKNGRTFNAQGQLVK